MNTRRSATCLSLIFAGLLVCGLELGQPRGAQADVLVGDQQLNCDGGVLYSFDGRYRLRCQYIDAAWSLEPNDSFWGFHWDGWGIPFTCPGWSTVNDRWCVYNDPQHYNQSIDAGLGGYLIMQLDGNLVLYTGNGAPVWDTQTYGNPGAWFAAQDDGNLVIRTASNVPIWSIW